MTEKSYSVRSACEVQHNHPAIAAESPEAAALAFVERWCPNADDEVRVLVTDCDTGAEQCLTLDLSSGHAAPC